MCSLKIVFYKITTIQILYKFHEENIQFNIDHM